MQIKRLLNFLELTLKFRDVYRTIKIPGKVSTENDAEHSYQLALLAWYISDSDNLGLDTNKLVKYSLVHDFVEVYAGDVTLADKDSKHAAKESNEELARFRLAKEYPEFSEFHDTIIEYELKKTEEARFIYALDKIIGDMNVYLEGNSINIEKGITLEMIREKKDRKIALHSHIEKYWLDFMPLREALEKRTMSHGD